MSVVHIHYRASDGEIFGHENTLSPDKQPGLEIASVQVPDGYHVIPDAMLHKIDVVTLKLIDKTETERERSRRPPPVTLDQIVAAIRTALAASDAYMMPDRPMTDAVLAAWVEYRKMLRGLSKLSSVDEMVTAWMPDPGGRDPVPEIRDRLARGGSA